MRVTVIAVVVLAVGLIALAGCHPHHWPHHVCTSVSPTEAISK